MTGRVSWILGCFIAGCYFISPPAPLAAAHYYEAHHYQPWHRLRPLPPPPARRSVDIMTDAVNSLGTRILQQFVESGNVAFSPAGVGFILAALYEGSGGRSRQQIVDCLGFPRDRNIVRIGMRDIYQRLRTYLNPDGFLGGLNLNRENTNLRSDYENVLRYYGFDLTIDLSNFTESNSNNFGLKSSMTTTTTSAMTMGGITSSPSGTMPTMTEMTMIPTTVPSTVTPYGVLGATITVNGATLSTNAATMQPTTLSTTIDTSVVLLSTPAATTPSPPSSLQSATGGPATTTTMPQPASTNIQATTAATTAAITVTQQPTTRTVPPSTNAAVMSTTSGATQTTVSQSATTTQIPPTTTTTTTTTTMTTTMPPSPSTATFMSTTTINAPETTTMSSEDIATVAPTTNPPPMVRRRRHDRRRRNSEGYFSNYPDDGLWMQDLDIWSDQEALPTNVRDATDLQFLVNGCELTSVPGATYTAVLPFAYFPTLKAVALEFPLDNPRYNVLLFLPTERVDTGPLARQLAGQNLRLLRKQLQPTWVRATIPSFMLRGFVTLTPFLQRLGIRDVFEPRLADLSPMTPDLGVYARDIQQSIAVNIKNYMKTDDTQNGMMQGQDGQQQQQQTRGNTYRFLRPGNGLLDRVGVVSFTAEHPFLYFIIDDETSVSLIAGRIDDPLNSRIL